VGLLCLLCLGAIRFGSVQMGAGASVTKDQSIDLGDLENVTSFTQDQCIQLGDRVGLADTQRFKAWMEAFVFPVPKEKVLELYQREKHRQLRAMTMHDEFLSQGTSLSPSRSARKSLARGKPPIDIDTIADELFAMGAVYLPPGVELMEHCIDRVLGLGPSVDLTSYELPWLDPQVARWERSMTQSHPHTNTLISVTCYAVEHLRSSYPDRFSVFIDAVIEEGVRLSDTRDPVAARVLALLVRLVLAETPIDSDLFDRFDKAGIVKASLLAPHHSTIMALVRPFKGPRKPVVDRITAYTTMALKPPHAHERWSYISHYLAGLACLQYCKEHKGRSEFEYVKYIVKQNLEAIGLELEAVFKLLSLDDPDLESVKSIALPGDERTGAAPRLRQDDPKILGLDPAFFLKQKPEVNDSDCEPFIVNAIAFSKAIPSVDNFNMMAYVGSGACYCSKDYNEGWISPLQWQAAAQKWPELGATHVASGSVDEIITAMPEDALVNNFSNFHGGEFLFAYYLVHTAHTDINDSFQAKMAQMFPNHYHPAKIKSVGRTFVKATVDYEKEDQPRAACVVDLVRCMLQFKNCGEMRAAFDKLCKNCDVRAVKNTFPDKAPDFGYRQVLVSVAHTSESGKTMICEVQMHLEAFVSVRESLHVYYSIYRCSEWSSFKDFVGPERQTFGHLESPQ